TEFMRLFGSTAKRALIFTNVTHGRSPLVAVRIYPFKPSAVIVHGPSSLDPVAIEIARRDNLPLGLCNLPSVKDLLAALEDLELIEKTKNK
ncbi:MAG: transcriptional regulator, partial [Candidatus Brockarchaeota archaeon]|nr:transcriptional regulator [Candidatus Brockarchaeota archaeon]